jgi:hypothetical protein
VAWRVFTGQMGSWWPLAHYKIGKTNAVDAIIEPGVGDRWLERGEDGSTSNWVSVLAWDPPWRLPQRLAGPGRCAKARLSDRHGRLLLVKTDPA